MSDNNRYILTKHQLWEFGLNLLSEGFMRGLDINSDFPTYRNSFSSTCQDAIIQKAIDKLKVNE